MGTFLKQPRQQAKKRETTNAKETLTLARVVVTGPDTCDMPSPSMQHDINHVEGLDGIEASLDWIAKGIAHLSSDDFNFSLSHARNTYPVQMH